MPSSATSKPRACPGDRASTLPETAKAKANACGNWHLHTGTVQIFIVGDAAEAWLACSLPEYRTGHKPGTPAERKRAHRALEILRRDHNLNPQAGPKEIRAALQQASSK